MPLFCVSIFLADRYGNPPNPMLQGNRWYGLFVIVVVVLFGVILTLINRKGAKKIERKENDKKEMQDNDKGAVPNQNDKSNSEDL
jgi:hypothetical protein